MTGPVKAVAATLLVATWARAEEATRPAYRNLRYEEDWSALRDPSARTDPLDTLKYIPLTRAGDAWLTLGGELREDYEYVRNPSFGAVPQDRRGTLLHRTVLHGDLHATPSARVFVQLHSALAFGRAGGPSPVDEDQLDLQQAFADLKLGGPGASVVLRAGRQELSYGAGRLIDAREGPNVRRKFDGARAIVAAGAWRVDAMGVFLARDERGIFDDGINRDVALWGAYGVVGRGAAAPGALDLYYLGLRDEAAPAAQGTAGETRHTVGARWFGAPIGTAWDWDFDVRLQAGRHGAGAIRAWAVASHTGYTFQAVKPRPRLGLRGDIASGDRDAASDELQTFNPMFPIGKYFSEIAVLGPRNFFDLHPSLALQPAPWLTLAADLDLFWRQSLGDGVYAVNGNVLRAPRGSRARYVGTQPQLWAQWRMGRHVSVTWIYARFFPGRFIEETGAASDIDHFELIVRFVL